MATIVSISQPQKVPSQHQKIPEATEMEELEKTDIEDRISQLEREFKIRIDELRTSLQVKPADDEKKRTSPKHEIEVEENAPLPEKKCAQIFFESLQEWKKKHPDVPKFILVLVLVLCFEVYFCYAMYYSFGDEGSIRLLVVVVFVIIKLLVGVGWSKFGKYQSRRLRLKLDGVNSVMWKRVRFMLCLASFIIVMTYVIVDVAMYDLSNLKSLLGIAGFVLLALVTSKSPRKVKWRIVIVGLTLQIILALIILRTRFGVSVFQWLGDRITEFLLHTNAGSKFVFGDAYQEHYIIFAVLPVVVFCSSVIGVLYYLGVMQWIIVRFSWCIQNTMGTTAGESVIAAGNVFFGSAEAPLLIKPLLAKLTTSELHAVMTCGFATISGSVLAAYISMGVPANHLLSASILSAIAALAIAKLSFPELGRSVLRGREVRKNLGKSEDKSLLEAASSGAVAAIPLVAGIAVNLIAFVAILEMVDETLSWIGDRVGYSELSVRLISSYVLWPLAYVMGCPVIDCRKVASLLGIRAFLNEFIAYGDLGKMIENRLQLEKMNYTGILLESGNDLILLDRNNTKLELGILTEKSEVIATYALCGFAGCIGLGIMLGVMTAAIPSRKTEITQNVLRAVFCGTMACYLTASIAGLLFTAKS